MALLTAAWFPSRNVATPSPRVDARQAPVAARRAPLRVYSPFAPHRLGAMAVPAASLAPRGRTRLLLRR
jgi:hypothetical protein